MNNIYDFESLLHDDFFISSVKKPTEENKLFWENLIKKRKLNREDFDLACYFIQSVQQSLILPSSLEVSEMWVDIKEQNEKLSANKRRNIRIKIIFSSIAASILILLTIFLLSKKDEEKEFEKTIETILCKIDTFESSEVTLVLSDNEKISLSDKSPQISYNTKGEIQVNSTVLEQNEKTKETSAINQIIVPKGKYTILYLSDGSRLSINKSTRVIYPVCFDDKIREIFVEGEVFADVYPDPNRPFIIRTNNLIAKVTGTSLNVNAYKGGMEQVVLVHGEVSVKLKNTNEIKLLPSQLYSYSNEGTSVETVNVYDYILWKDGIQQYENGNFGEILNHLSDYYGEKIIYSEEVSKLKCSGKLDIDKPLNEVLDGIQHAVPIVYLKKGDVYIVSIKP